ncbi:hypothetical protein ACN47E_001723 [Coniothyrium glycines]
MRLETPSITHNVLKRRQLLAPLLFLVLATVVNTNVPVQHSLFVTAIAWTTTWLASIPKAGVVSNTSVGRRRTCWLAGAFLSLSYVCDRAALDKQGVWATKALLPLLTALLAENNFLSPHVPLLTFTLPDAPSSEAKPSTELVSSKSSYKLLVATTICAGAVLAIYTTSPTFALGTSSVLFGATGLVLLGYVIGEAEFDDTGLVRNPTNSSASTHRGSMSAAGRVQQVAAFRDTASAIAVICGLACYFMELSITSTSIAWEPVYQTYAGDWREVHNYRILLRVMWSLPSQFFLNVLTYLILSQTGAVNTSILILSSLLCAKLLLAPSLLVMWFTLLYGIAALLSLSGSSSANAIIEVRGALRTRRLFYGSIVLSIGFFTLKYASGLQQRNSIAGTPPLSLLSPITPFAPMPMDLSKGHPAAQLIKAAEEEFQNIVNKQSTSLADAVREYRRRNGIAPPPNFDKWYEFAVRNGVVMIDEFDMINEMLLPFWAIKPATLRSRVANALGHEDSALVAVAIRHGAIENFENGEKWQQQATVGMMKKFVHYLPDMDLGFNIHDEPRVMVPQNLLSPMINKARDEVLSRVAKVVTPLNAFSARPDDLNDGTQFTETSTTRFNRFAHQQTWTHSRLSCAPDSQAQTFEDYAADNLTAYAAGPLNYIYNTTAFSDICNSPSFSSTFGFFERPNTFNIVHELTPVFSQSKISSFQDILYPSPWYWAGRVAYDPDHDTTWENKTNSIYWRGSTTGGFSRNGGWRRQHRQHIVRRLNAPDRAKIVHPVLGSSASDVSKKNHEVLEIDRRSLKHLIDIQFSHIGQCDPGDCDAQKEFFHITDRVDGQDAWYHKHLLDMDGNAFSGRFYSFLKSHSLTYKMAVFREWHSEWLKPWVHYIPLSLTGDEHLDLIKWFSGDSVLGADGTLSVVKEYADKDGNGDSEGEKKAREMAERSTVWHDKVLRNVDFEVWLFRLLLEYGRVVDDNREEIGYPGP